jgi:DNA-binding HxlR family transcriptional regulator
VAPRGGYRQACAIARGLDLVGERWALLVVRELLLGPKRFTDLRTALPGASPNALTARLQELERSGIVRHRRLPPPASAWVYELTDRGRGLEPILLALGTWALGSERPDRDAFLSTDSVMLSIRTYFRPDGVEGSGAITIRLLDEGGERTFGVWISPDGAEVRHESPSHPDAIVSASASELVAALASASAPDLAAGAIDIGGDAELARRLIEGVVVPEPDGLTPENEETEVPAGPFEQMGAAR